MCPRRHQPSPLQDLPVLLDVDEAFTPRLHDPDHPLATSDASPHHPFRDGPALQRGGEAAAEGQGRSAAHLEALQSLRARGRSVPDMSGTLRSESVGAIEDTAGAGSGGEAAVGGYQTDRLELAASARGQAGLDRTASADAVQSSGLRISIGARSMQPSLEEAGVGGTGAARAQGRVQSNELQLLREQVAEQFQTVAEELSMQRYMIHQVSWLAKIQAEHRKRAAGCRVWPGVQVRDRPELMWPEQIVAHAIRP